jgi:hypothetical protein
MPTTRVHDLVTIASRLSGISEADIRGTGRLRVICRVRQAAMYAAHLQGVHSLAQIGRLFGKDHTTVIHARDAVPEFMKRDPEYRAFVWQILVDAFEESPHINARKFQFTLTQPKPIYIVKPKPKPVEEDFYYGGGYSMNREAAA